MLHVNKATTDGLEDEGDLLCVLCAVCEFRVCGNWVSTSATSAAACRSATKFARELH